MKIPSIFPNAVWNGLSQTRDSLLIDRPPDFEDHDRVTSEIMAMEAFLINLTGGVGSVSSVGLSMPSGFSVDNSPITTIGSLDVTTILSGIVKGDGSGFIEATVGSDYYAPGNTISTDDIALATYSTPGIIAYNSNDFSISDGIVSAIKQSLVVKTAILGKNVPLTTGTNILDIITVPGTGTVTLSRVKINAVTAPTGSALILDIKIADVSIGGSLQLAADTDTATITSFTNPTSSGGSRISLDITQIGSIVAGQDVTVELEFLVIL